MSAQMVIYDHKRSAVCKAKCKKCTITGEEKELAQHQKASSKLRYNLNYIRKNWQLYVIFALPAVVLTFIFKYIPMGGILIAFEDYNPMAGIFGSEWVGF